MSEFIAEDLHKTTSEPSLPTIDEGTRRWLIEEKKENRKICEGSALFSEDSDRLPKSPRRVSECQNEIRRHKRPICSTPDGTCGEPSRYDDQKGRVRYRPSSRRSKTLSFSMSSKHCRRERSRSLSVSSNHLRHTTLSAENGNSRRHRIKSSTGETDLRVYLIEEASRLGRRPMVSHGSDQGVKRQDYRSNGGSRSPTCSRSPPREYRYREQDHRAPSPCAARRSSPRRFTDSRICEEDHRAPSPSHVVQKSSPRRSTDSRTREEGNHISPSRSLKSNKSRGVDLVVIGFGEPGTGKTYTLSGLNKTHAERGFIPRALEEIFLIKEWHTDMDVKIGVTYVEFTENKCYNLLGRRMMEIPLDKIKPIKTDQLSEALDLLFRGEPRRKFEGKGSNCGSSVYTIHVECMSVNEQDANILSSKIHFVDTAGIETIWKPKKSEICSISSNMDKFSVDRTSRWAYYLAKSIENPSKSKNYPAVYGTSNLIKYLNRSFTHGFVTLVGFIKPKGEELRLTLSTLRFGCKVARLHCGLLETHKRPSSSRVTAKLKDEIDELRTQIETSKLMRLGEYNHWNVCQGEAQHIERLIKSYLKTSYTDRVTETCLLSTARPSLLLEEIRRQYQDESFYITSHFPLKVSVQSGLPSISEMPPETFSKTKKGHGKSKKRQSVGTINEVSSLKDVTADDTKSVGMKSAKSARKSTTGSKRKSKSVGSRKSMAPKKSKGGSKKRKGGSVAKVEEPPAINAEFLEKGKRDRTWLLDQFLLRNKELAEEKKTIESAYITATEAKLSKAKELDELRASLARTRLQLNDVQWRRNYTMVVPPAVTPVADEIERLLIANEKEMCTKISKASEELAVLHAALNDTTSVYDGFDNKLQKLFGAWCRELYQIEILEEEIGNFTASMLDREVPRQTIVPSKGLETESELDFIEMQESYFRKKLPVRPIQHENP